MRALVAAIAVLAVAASVRASLAVERVSVRERIERATAVSRELAAKAQEAPAKVRRMVAPQPRLRDDRKNEAAMRFPRREHVARYLEAKPWSRCYAWPLHRVPASPAGGKWPRAADAEELVRLLGDKDGAIRCLAAEALATLHRPEDIPRLARLLADEGDGPPELAQNMQRTAMLIRPPDMGGLDLLRAWQPRTVRIYARRALKLMTGRDFSHESFPRWWQANQPARHRVWYWQQRLMRELSEAVALPAPSRSREPGETYAQWSKRVRGEQAKRRAAVLDAIAAELRKLPAEVEAKVRLLAANRGSTALGVGLDSAFWPTYDCGRLPPERLLALLARKGLWEDVQWQGDAGRGNYNRMVIVLAGSAHKLFRQEHVARLRAVLAKERGKLWWSGQAALTTAISRLLPPAKAAELDDPDTRDGFLRAALRHGGQDYAQAPVAARLVAVGLPRNWAFLKQAFFGEAGLRTGAPAQQAIIRALGAQPLTPLKRAALRDLLLDERFKRFWTLSNRQGMGRDMYRVYAIQAVNAHAGKTVLTYVHKQELNNPETAARTLPEVLRLVATALADERPQAQAPR